MWRRFYEKGGIRRLLLALTPTRTDTTICPYCKDELPIFHDHEDACYQCGTFLHPEPGGFHCEPEPTWTCPRCSTSMHQECHDELATCTTLGCSGRTRRPPVIRTTARTTHTPEAPARSYPPWWIFVLGPTLLVAFVLMIMLVIKWLMGLGG